MIARNLPNHLASAFRSETERGIDWLRNQIKEPTIDRDPMPADASPAELAAEVIYIISLTAGFGDNRSVMAVRTATALVETGLLAEGQLTLFGQTVVQ